MTVGYRYFRARGLSPRAAWALRSSLNRFMLDGDELALDTVYTERGYLYATLRTGNEISHFCLGNYRKAVRQDWPMQSLIAA